MVESVGMHPGRARGGPEICRKCALFGQPACVRNGMGWWRPDILETKSGASTYALMKRVLGLDRCAATGSRDRGGRLCVVLDVGREGGTDVADRGEAR